MYYLDIETTGLDEHTNKIITIQYQQIERYTGRTQGPLKILKEWEYGEKEILEAFISETSIHGQNDFDFIAVGTHLEFEQKFLSAKTKHYNLKNINVTQRPHIDIKNILILMNKGEFKGSGLDNMTGKKHNGAIIVEWYNTRMYDMIEQYILNETTEFLKFYGWLYDKMPMVWREFKDKFMS